MPFKLNRNKKDHADPLVVDQDLEDHAAEVARKPGQSAADPTGVESTLTSQSDLVARNGVNTTDTVDTVSEGEGQSAADPTENDATVAMSAEESVWELDPISGRPRLRFMESEVTGPAETVEQEITSRGDEFIQETPEVERVLIETCEPAVVGPPEAVAAAALETVKPGTALVAVKQEEKEVVVKKPIISERMKKTWGRSVKDPERKANLLLPGVHPDFAGDLVITVLSAVNPKLPGKGPWFRFAKYRTGMTVAEYIKTCERVSPSVKVSHADLKWDVNHGYIRVEAAAKAGAPKAVEEAA